jgi:hypothetical protein
MAGEQLIPLVDQNRDQEAKFVNSTGKLIDLLLRMDARVFWIGPQAPNW